ncbi:MAG: MurR/RpiR family transcriptional regulator [Gammaproteobacteria bacterium]|nr:MurR/RpiR family transcriptional regulator [Gammaproteobacteria bacterium]
MNQLYYDLSGYFESHSSQAVFDRHIDTMETTFSDTRRKLVDSFSELTPQLQIAARYFLDHPEDVGLNSMRTVAAGAGVQPATVSRLSRALGFSSYKEFREPFRQRLRRPDPGYAKRVRDVQRRGSDDAGALFEEVRTQDIENLELTLADEQYPMLLEAVETLLLSRRVYVLGLRGAYSAAFLFHYAYQLFRNNSQLLDTAAGIFADQLRGINDEDSMLVISFAPYTRLTIDAVDYAAETGGKIVAITDSELSPVAQAATHTIIAHHTSPSFYQSFTSALAVCQALITLLASKTDGDALEIVKEAENQLAGISAYL